jgi:hypothetical protein
LSDILVLFKIYKMNPLEKDIPESSISKGVSSRPIKKQRSFLKFVLLILSYVIVAALAWKVAEQWEVDPAKQQARAEGEIRSTVDRVRKLMILPDPATELPQVAVVNDAEGLAKSQAFFAGVKNGDQVLIYLKSQKAIIYRASENKIVNVGPVIADGDGSANAKSAAITPATSQSSSTASEASSENSR